MEHHNQCVKKARAAKVRLRTLTKTFRIVPDNVRVIQLASAQAVALYASELWWDPEKVGCRDDLQLLLDPQATSVLGALPTTLPGALMSESARSHKPVVLDSRQQRFAARLADPCSSKLEELHEDLSSGKGICRVVEIDHEHGRTTEHMSWLAPGEKRGVKTIILDDKRTAKRTAQPWARE